MLPHVTELRRGRCLGLALALLLPVAPARAEHDPNALIDAFCDSPDSVVARQGERTPFDVTLAFENASTGDVHFVAHMPPNPFFADETFFERTQPPSEFGFALIFTLTTEHFPVASDRVTIEITSDATGDTVLGRCDFTITILPGAAIRLDPAEGDNAPGASHTITATVTLEDDPLPGTPVTFEVVAGPNAGETSSPGECAVNPDCATDASGRTSWTYTSNGSQGVDTIRACFVDDRGESHCAEAINVWFGVADAVEDNDTLDRATGRDAWEHDHWQCPDYIRRALLDPDADCSGVFEDGPAPRGAVESWTLLVADLSLHSTDDRDFFRVRIPDPAAAPDGGHPDISPAGGPEPLPECGFVERQDFGPRGRDNTVTVAIRGRLIVEIVPTANAAAIRPIGAAGESIRLYRDGALDPTLGSGGPLTMIIECPRSREGLTELVLSFGERDAPREPGARGGYEIRLEYRLEIERGIPGWVGEEFVGGLPCARALPVPPLPGPGGFLPRDDLPFCPPDPFGVGHVELPHPLDPRRRPDCLADGCPEIFSMHWPATDTAFTALVRSGVGLSFKLFDAARTLVGEAGPLDPKGPGIDRATADIQLVSGPLSLLFVPRLEPGLYFLVVEGPEAPYAIDFLTPALPALVPIDVRPGSLVNPLNLRSRGVVPVAVLTTDAFDAATLDAATVRFGPAGALDAHGRAHLEDVDGDGDGDLLFHFAVSEAGLGPGHRTACLTGRTASGVTIQGCDHIRVVK